MREILFASSKVARLASEDTLPAKFGRLLQQAELEHYFAGKAVAIKMHLGVGIGYSTIPPLFVRLAAEAVKRAGGRPFVTDGSGSFGGAKERGYTEEVLGSPLKPAAGEKDEYFVETPINYRSLDSIQICGNIAEADALLVLSHGKGHGQCGFGGAIKNLAMGCVTGESRGDIHRLMDTAFTWKEEACGHCYLCRDNCPGGAVRFDDKDKLWIFFHHCRYCMHCVDSCPEKAITINLDGIRYFQEGMARATKAVLDTFNPASVYYLNFLMNITPLCDCWGFTTPSLVPDVGILGAPDMVAIEQASLDKIDYQNYIEGSLPEQLTMGEKGHLFERIHHKDPYLQVETAAELGLGSRQYVLREVK
jgi:uncharacterized protein